MDKKLLMYVFIGFLIGYFFQSIMKSGFCRITEGFSDGDSVNPEDYNPVHHATCDGLIENGVLFSHQRQDCMQAQACQLAIAEGRIAPDDPCPRPRQPNRSNQPAP